VLIEHPRKGDKKHLLELAVTNAADLLSRAAAKEGEALLERTRVMLQLQRLPRKVEGLDISNIHGQDAVGSMVVFLEGRPAPQAYRRFRIRGTDQPDDYAMMQEVLYRRLRRLRRDAGEDAGLERPDAGGEGAGGDADPGDGAVDRLGRAPDLVLVDGGKGHLSAATEVLGDLGLDIPVLALAKEKEEVHVPGRPVPLDLPEDSAASQLLRHIRDEAHRFAVGYHRLLRRKVARRSELDSVPGVGPARRTALLRAFGSTAGVREASLEQLSAVPGVGPAAARKIWDYFHGVSARGGRGDSEQG